MGRNKNVRRAGFIRYDDKFVPARGHETAGRAAGIGLTRSGVDQVQLVWQELCDFTLSRERGEEFRHHRDAIRLADCTPSLLVNAARVAKANIPRGHLLLAEWWSVAQARVGGR